MNEEKQPIDFSDLLGDYDVKEVRPGVYTHTLTPNMTMEDVAELLYKLGKEEIMSNTPRDTHFQEFANLVYIDLLNADLLHLPVDGMTTPSLEIENGVSEMRDKIIHLIAQRAYDLVYHAFMTASTVTLEHANMRCIDDEDIKDVPDLTKWPEV